MTSTASASATTTISLFTKLILIVFQLIGITAAVSGTSSPSRFATTTTLQRRRHSGPVRGIHESSPFLFSTRRRRGNTSSSSWNDDDDSSPPHSEHDSIFDAVPSDERTTITHIQESSTRPECQGRFAVEYEFERTMIRSAEIPLLQKHRSINIDGEQHTSGGSHDGYNTNNSAYRIKPISWFFSRTTGTTTPTKPAEDDALRITNSQHDPIFV